MRNKSMRLMIMAMKTTKTIRCTIYTDIYTNWDWGQLQPTCLVLIIYWWTKVIRVLTVQNLGSLVSLVSCSMKKRESNLKSDR